MDEVSTTLSHRALTPAQRAALGITSSAIRLALGVESADFIRAALAEGLEGGGVTF